MDLYRQGLFDDVTTTGVNPGLTYSPPEIGYGLPPQRPDVTPSYYASTMMPNPNIPPGVTDLRFPGSQQQQADQTIRVARGYKWKESAPVVVYMALSIAGLILIIFTPGSAKAKLLHLLGAILWIVIWGIFVVWASKKGKNTLAWVLAIVPFVIWLVFQILLFIKAVSINV